MKIGPVTFYFVAVALGFSLITAGGQPQSGQPTHPTDFSTEQFYEPPHQQQVKLRLSGASVQPLPGGLLDVKELRVVTFSVNGTSEAVVRAPQCVYAPLDGVASSAGHLELQSGDGKIRVEGEGFLWRQNESLLTISNRVHTVIQMLSDRRGLFL